METDSPNSVVSPELAAAFQDFTAPLRNDEDKTASDLKPDDDRCPMEAQKSNLKDRRRTKSLPVSPEQACLLESCVKRVQFADTLGLDLANVKHFNVTEDPHVPSKVLRRLRSYPLDEPQDDVTDVCHSFSSSLKLYRLTPLFTTPVKSDNFTERLLQCRIALENVSISNFDVKGVIQVIDTDSSRKEVGVRHTSNNWLTFVDTKAVHESGNTQQELWNQFVFTIYIPPYVNPDFSVQFAVYYFTDDGEYWDNNEGRNYTLRWDCT